MEPKNLQIIKNEQTTEKYSNTIKERLNLHVKRRLQQEAQQTPTKMSFPNVGGVSSTITAAAITTTTTTAPATAAAHITTTTGSKSPAIVDNAAIPRSIQKQQMKETPKTRRPYQRRIDRTSNKTAIVSTATTTTTPTTTSTLTSQLIITTNAATLSPPTENLSPVRKRRQKTKQQQQNVATNPITTTSPTTTKSTAAVLTETNLATINNEEDGSHDGMHDLEARTVNARDKKCPDILGMVLSMKRRALLQDPEVTEFLHNIMAAIKS